MSGGVVLTLEPSWWAVAGPSYEGLLPAPSQEVVLSASYELGPATRDLWIDPTNDGSASSLIAYADQLIRDYEGRASRVPTSR